MPTLEADIDRLKEYNALRIVAGRMRDDGLKALAASVDKPSERPWRHLEGVLERAEVLKALLQKRVRDEKDFKRYRKLAEPLEEDGITIQKVMSEDPDPLPVLRAAKAMCALAAAPDSAFSEPVMYYLYCIVREIQMADQPDWAVGSARAGSETMPSGYVTWQCVRAISDFQQALRNTARMIKEIATMLKITRYEDAYLNRTSPTPKRSDAIQTEWEKRDEERLALSFVTTITSLRDNIALRLDVLNTLESKEPGAALTFIKAIRGELESRIKDHKAAFMRALRNIEAFRRTEFQTRHLPDIRRLRTESAHLLGCATVREARMYTKKALRCLRKKHPPVDQLTDLAGEFTSAAEKFSNLMAPIRSHVSRALDRELAAVMTQGSSFAWDPAEMAFAAAAYGEISESWKDERILRAVGHLLQIVGERGQVPTVRPISTSKDGSRLFAFNGETLRALARVLENVEGVQVESVVVERMLAFFQDLQTREKRGIFQEPPQHEPHDRRTTATAVLALGAINRMLDERINRMVYKHFSTRAGDDELKLSLRDLFYGDYGLRHEHPVQKKPYAGVVLELMRAHVAGVASRVRAESAPFSLVLHGPPGTGKTMMVEALARSCGVTLVEVTPSDIVIGGEEQIERRTRDVMFALSLLTRTIILFDEFDPVLLRRTLEEKQPSVFSFLTPGMLPKLKNLYERAKERSTAYVLITNLIGKLDDAAIREGRFDVHLGIYPPDLLSRYGRLKSEVEKYETEAGRLPRKPDHRQRFWKLVQASCDGSMTTLGKPSWFTKPRDRLEPASAFGYLYDPAVDDIPGVPRESTLELTFVPPYVDSWMPGEPEPGLKGAQAAAVAEFKEWAWIHRWDKKASRIKRRPGTLPPLREPKNQRKAIDCAYRKAVDELRDRTSKPLAVVCRIENGGPPGDVGTGAAKPTR
jgi:hypothetical protein